MTLDLVWLMVLMSIITMRRVSSFDTEADALSWLNNWLSNYNRYWSGDIDFDEVWQDITAPNAQGSDDGFSIPNYAKAKALTNAIRRKTDTDQFDAVVCDLSADNTYGPTENTLIIDCTADVVFTVPITATVSISMDRVFIFNSDGLITGLDTTSQGGIIGNIISRIARTVVGDTDAFVVEFAGFQLDRLDLLFGSVFLFTTTIIVAALCYIIKKVNAMYNYFDIAGSNGYKFSKLSNQSSCDEQSDAMMK